MARTVVVAGSATSFVVAAVAGVLGNQLAADAIWAWCAFAAALVVGAAVTALVAHRADAPSTARVEVAAPASPPDPGPSRASTSAGAQVGDARQDADPERSASTVVQGPLAQRGDVVMRGRYVAGRDLTIDGGRAETPRKQHDG